MRTQTRILEEVRSPESRAVGRLATLSSRFQAGDCGVSNLSIGCQLGARCHHHLFLVRCTAPVVFALGVLAARYGKKLHGAIVEAGFFKPNLYAHLPAVSFVD